MAEHVVPAVARRPINVSFLSFTTAMGLSSLGDAAWYVALTWRLVAEAGPATAGAALALAGSPRLAGLLFGGVLADRTGPRRLMVVTDLVRAGVMLGAAVAVAALGPTVPLLIGAAVLLALMSAFFIPASGAVRPLLLEEKDLVRGNALYGLGLRGGQAAGGPLGGLLLAAGGVPLVAVVNAASYLVSATASAKVRYTRRPKAPAAPAPRPPFHTQLVEGLRYLAGMRRVRLVILMVGLTELACAPPVNLGLVLLSQRLNAGATGAGVLLTAYTVGAVAGSLLITAWPVGPRAGRSLVAGTALAGGCLAGIGLAGSLRLDLLCYLVLGLVATQFSVVLISMVQRWTEPAFSGRVMSVLSLVLFGAVPLANLLLGAAIQLAGFAAAMAGCALVAFAAAAVAVALPVLRGARLD